MTQQEIQTYLIGYLHGRGLIPTKQGEEFTTHDNSLIICMGKSYPSFLKPV